MTHSQNTDNIDADRISEIVKKIQSGNNDSFVYLVDAYRDRIITIAFSFGLSGSERDDLIQEGYIALYNAAKTYDSAKSQFTTYSTICIKRRMINWIEKNITPSLSSMSIADLDDSELSRIGMVQENFENDFIIKSEISDLLNRARNTLSNLEFNVFSLYIKGYTNNEICDKLSITKRSCDNSLFRLRKKLRSAKN